MTSRAIIHAVVDMGARQELPRDVVVFLPEGVPMEFRLIEAGSFLMGSRGYSNDEEPRHVVRIAAPFYMGTFPVTQRQFAVWTRSSGVEHKTP